MKTKLYVLLLVAVLTGCNDGWRNNDTNDNDLIIVGLSITGEVETKDDPLTRVNESMGLLGIQVYQDGEPYAYGLFDRLQNINLYLHSGHEYSIVSQYIKNGKRVLRYFSRGSVNTSQTYLLSGEVVNSAGMYGLPSRYYLHVWSCPDYVFLYDRKYYSAYEGQVHGYSSPFCISNTDYPGGEDPLHTRWVDGYSSKYVPSMQHTYYYVTSQNHEYTKGQLFRLCDIANGFLYSSWDEMDVTESAVVRDLSCSEEIDRYYGETGTFIASNGAENTISIDMKHLVYGLQCNVTGVSDGTASITIMNGNRVLLEKTDISGEFHSDELLYSFEDMHSAWQYADNYTENITVSMTWLRGVGVMQNLGSQVVQVKRNCMNVISVSLGTVFSAPALQMQSESFNIKDESFVPLINTYKCEQP